MVVPLYQKISEDLKDQILTHKIEVGEKLPTELELSETYHVSRITAKRALNELEQIGLVSRTRGKGSFVKKNSEKKTLSQTTKQILFILPFGESTFGDFTVGLIPYVKQFGYTVFITNGDYLRETPVKTIAETFDGLVFYPLNTDEFLDALFELSTIKFPVVLLYKKIYGLDFPCVMSDNKAGGFLATQALIDAGHTRIGFIMSDEIHHPQTTRNRYLGYIDALNHSSIDFHTPYNDPASNARVIVDYVKTSGLTGMICENDLIALGLMTELQNAGFHIPNDLSIVGFDDIQAAGLSNPPLTTIAQDFNRIGAEAGRVLMTWIETGVIPDDTYISVQLMMRQSTSSITTNTTLK